MTTASTACATQLASTVSSSNGTIETSAAMPPTTVGRVRLFTLHLRVCARGPAAPTPWRPIRGVERR
ncbi:hypothetical protein [Phytoactinopolyspora mesophila]|uniref:hypothetical protein n=1 Tax=Phytoactinopolyspora mesophila TaxID=2650750 RepID=UPI003CCDD55F